MNLALGNQHGTPEDKKKSKTTRFIREKKKEKGGEKQTDKENNQWLKIVSRVKRNTKIAEAKQKRIDNNGGKRKQSIQSSNNKKRRKNKKDEKHSGPRLPNQLRKQIKFLNHNNKPIHSDDEDGGLHINYDLYEYEEVIPEEESKKNRRFDPVDSLEYQLPEEFKDENILSDDEDGDDNDGSRGIEDSEQEDENHARMLQRITGMPSKAFDLIKFAFWLVRYTLDEGTRVAISNQLNQHAVLTRKINNMKDSSSSSDVEDDDDLEAVAEQDGPLKLLTRAKEKTLKIIEEEDEAATSGVLSLPFMVRGNERRKREVNEEAKLALKEYDSSLMELHSDEAERSKKAASSGRRVFSTAAKNQADEMSSKFKSNMVDRDRGSDSEEEFASKGFGDAVSDRNTVVSQKTVQIDPSGVLGGSFNTGQKPLSKMKSEHKKSSAEKKNSMVVHPALPLKETKEEDEDNGSESGEDMVDGILTSGTKQDYKLPSQADLIHNAFAGDDVEEEFEKEKLEALNEENPELEKPTLVPGWGQWTHIQKKKGLISWVVKEHAIAQKKRENALKERKDSHLKHAIISERLDKKAEKIRTATVPHPYTSIEDYEKTLLVPLGPEFNPATKVGALIRPEVVQKPGVIIKPIEYEEVDPREKSELKGKGKTQPKKNKSDNGKSVRKTKKLKTKTLL
ncbi:U3 small nucleolar RNA-associated protein 14-like [Papaver somniferum]|uniref:U3 small nucleolar RNA-associated protein 14-like n=1 Tax=Papaver somniferum TaxID=3469 RepID=UPI000E6FD8E5|nr:U3 small nucleolar RNA-associated protein 14-like [Papaver somniferum]